MKKGKQSSATRGRGSKRSVEGAESEESAPNEQDEVERLMKRQVANSTRESYLRKQVQFIALLYESSGLHGGSILQPVFFQGFPEAPSQSEEWRKSLKNKLAKYTPPPPLDLARLSARLVGEMTSMGCVRASPLSGNGLLPSRICFARSMLQFQLAMNLK